MTEREKLLETLKVAYEPRKIPQEDGSVAIYYPTDEDVADMIWAAIIDEYKHRAEVAEKDLERHKRALCCACKASAAVLTKELVKARVDCFLRKAEKELAEEEKK